MIGVPYWSGRELPPSVQPLKLSVAKFPLVTRLTGVVRVMARADESGLTLPAASVAVAVKLWLPLASAPVV